MTRPDIAASPFTEAKLCDDTEKTYGMAVVKILPYLRRTKDYRMRRMKTGGVKMLAYDNLGRLHSRPRHFCLQGMCPFNILISPHPYRSCHTPFQLPQQIID